MKNIVSAVRTKAGVIVTLIGGTTLLISHAAYAALPAAIGTGMTALTGDIEDLLDLIWPVAIAAAFGFALFKFFKKGVNKV